MSDTKLRSPQTAKFVDLWYATRVKINKAIPEKNEIPLRELAPFMPQIVLVETDHTDRGRYILFGTAVVAAFGVDMTGRYVDEVMDADALKAHTAERQQFKKQYGPDAIHGRWAIGQAYTNSGRLVEYEDLSLPYFEPSTGKARHMVYLTMLNELGFGEDVSTRLPSQKHQWFDASSERPSWLHQNSDALN